VSSVSTPKLGPTDNAGADLHPGIIVTKKADVDTRAGLVRRFHHHQRPPRMPYLKEPNKVLSADRALPPTNSRTAATADLYALITLLAINNCDDGSGQRQVIGSNRGNGGFEFYWASAFESLLIVQAAIVAQGNATEHLRGRGTLS